MKKKLIYILISLVLLFLIFSAGMFFQYMISWRPKFCREHIVSQEKKDEIIRKYNPTKNPFYGIEYDITKYKNIYSQREANENCFNHQDSFEWNPKAFFEDKDGNIYEIRCNK